MLAACVPGEIMGLWEAHKKFGILPWKELFQPAINFAENGFTVSKRLSNSLKYYEKQILATPSIRLMLWFQLFYSLSNYILLSSSYKNGF